MNCALDKCAHANSGACNTLGECGAQHLLNRLHFEVSVDVRPIDNPTLRSFSRQAWFERNRFQTAFAASGA
jgi:hypothetical protein